ncbi:MAG TPA: patatin-like phospholipase family protein [Solirubrobacterales bacterium]
MDGGGIRGIIPAIVLAELERRTGRSVAETFDLVAGTSTGGILALALTMRGSDGGPAWTAEQMIALYEEEGPNIFDRSVWDRIRSVEGLLDEKYPPAGMERAFRTYLGDARLSETLTEVLVTAYEIEQRTTFFFKSAKARADERDDFAIRDAAQATSAAPTYFEPVRLERGHGRPDLALVDGGVFANNPAMCAYAEALKDEADDEITLVSLGTGELTRALPYDEAKDWGLAEWAKPIIDVVFDGVSDATDHHLEQILGRDRYFRFQTRLDRARDDMDDATEGNLHLLKQEAEELLRDERDRFEDLVEALGP